MGKAPLRTKVTDTNVPVKVDEDVVQLHVTVQDPVLVEEEQCAASEVGKCKCKPSMVATSATMSRCCGHVSKSALRSAEDRNEDSIAGGTCGIMPCIEFLVNATRCARKKKGEGKRVVR